jgi:uncharacterized protein
MFFDPVYLMFLVPGLLLSWWASHRVKSTFAEYSQVPARSGMSGAQAARELLRRKGITNVRVEEVDGFLSDHYDPFQRVLRLSPDVYHGRSLASLGVAAHEAGHAIQHATAYGPLKFRSLVVKPASIGSNLGFILAGVGAAMNAAGLVWLGIALFSVFVLFTLVTLPVEFDASKRAVVALEQSSMIVSSERAGTQAVLNAAAMTYVAATVSAVLQLIYLLMRAGVFGGRREES